MVVCGVSTCVCVCVCVFRCTCVQRSRSAFSLTSDDSPEKGPEEQSTGAGGGFPEYASLKREAKATSLPSWKSVDRLDNSSKSHTLFPLIPPEGAAAVWLPFSVSPVKHLV